jgi:dUTPase
MENKVEIRQISPHAVLPKMSNMRRSGLIYTIYTPIGIGLQSGVSCVIHTGLEIRLGNNIAFVQACPPRMINVIPTMFDQEFAFELDVTVVNNSNDIITFNQFDAIAELCFLPRHSVQLAVTPYSVNYINNQEGAPASCLLYPIKRSKPVTEVAQTNIQ